MLPYLRIAKDSGNIPLRKSPIFKTHFLYAIRFLVSSSISRCYNPLPEEKLQFLCDNPVGIEARTVGTLTPWHQTGETLTVNQN